MKLLCMVLLIQTTIIFFSSRIGTSAEDTILGCNGFIRSDISIDFSKVEVKLISKEGNLKDKIECAPNNGYFFLPLYDKGDYVLQISSVHGWVFEPPEMKVKFDGVDDLCSRGKDIIFTFVGFRVFGKVDSVGDKKGPKGITIKLISNSPGDQETISSVQTEENGSFAVFPVLPGSYVLEASHPRWLLSKNSVSLTIEKSNFEVPRQSLLFAGYDVSGSVVSSGEPIAGVNFVLFAASDNNVKSKWIHGCNSSALQDFNYSDLKLTNVNQLCHVTSDEKGVFSFAAVPSGNYVLVPFYKGVNALKFEVHPRVVRFSLLSESHVFSKPFLVSGFSVLGRVYSSSVDSKAISGLKVILDKEKTVETNVDGSFSFDGVKTGVHNIQVKGDDYQFKNIEVKIAPNSAVLETIYPTGIKVCGNVQKLQSVQIQVVFADVNGKEYSVQTQSDGSFCLFLTPGDYGVKIVPAESPSGKLLWFFPINHSIKLINTPLKNINFRQEAAELTGVIECDESASCYESDIVLRGLGTVEEEYHQTTEGGKYRFTDLYPGHYEISVSNNGDWCWEHTSQKVYISEVQNKAPPFRRIGISFMVSSSHNTKLMYKKLSSNRTVLKEGVLDIENGIHKYCLPGNAVYELVPTGCHRYAESVIRWEIGQDSLMLTALSHKITVLIFSLEMVDDIVVNIYNDDVEFPKMKIGPLISIAEKKLNYNYKYELSFQAAADEKLILVPESSSVLFTPANLTVYGADDCMVLNEFIHAELGVRLEGKVQPPLEDVKISIVNESDEIVASMLTDATGKYKFPPLQAGQNYRVVGKKEGYILSGPLEGGVFKVHKLAEIRVSFVDDQNKPLQGVLLSLSGGENYRQTSQSNPEGRITFLSLKPGEYYLRPMLKEYRFSPSSKVTTIQEGETSTVSFRGHRVLYSVFGHVYSLNHFPEKDIVVEAISKAEGECNVHQEEGTTDENGLFRIRGLKPQCSYEIRLKKGMNTNKKIHKSLPENMQIKMNASDVENINLVTVPDATQSDVSVFLESSSPEYLHTLIIRLLNDDGGVVSSFKLGDWKISRYSLKNVLLPFPTLPLDNKNYYIRLESTLPKSTFAHETQTAYFSANTTFQLIKMSFIPELRLPDSDIKHSYASAIVILILGIAYWCKESILSALSQLQNNSGFTVSEFLTRYPPKGKDTEKTFIEFEPGLTVVKRKLKPRKM